MRKIFKTWLLLAAGVFAIVVSFGVFGDKSLAAASRPYVLAASKTAKSLKSAKKPTPSKKQKPDKTGSGAPVVLPELPVVASAKTQGIYVNPLSGAFITLSDYYLIPGKTFKVSGRGFAPNEDVKVAAGSLSQTVKADKDGQFTTGDFTVPMNNLGFKILVSAKGSASNILKGAELKIGTYYPLVNPSSYYVMPGGDISFGATGFAPSESVKIELNKQTLATVNSDSSGSFSTQNFKAPGSVGEVVYIFTGQNSKISKQVSVKVGQRNF